MADAGAELEERLRRKAAELGVPLSRFLVALREERRAGRPGPFSAALVDLAAGWRDRRSVEDLLREIEERQRGSERPEVI